MNKKAKEPKQKKGEKIPNIMKEHEPILTAHGWEKRLKASKEATKKGKK